MDVGAVRFRFREINFSFAYEVNDRCGFGGTVAIINLHLAGTITLWRVITVVGINWPTRKTISLFIYISYC